MNFSSVSGKHWSFKRFDSLSVDKLVEDYSLSEITAKLLSIRKSNIDNIELFLNPKIKNLPPNELTACVLKRPRHEYIVKILNEMGVKIKFIADGDVYGVISIADQFKNVDIYLGTGGGPEGVLAAAALSCLGCQMQTRLVIQNIEEKDRVIKLGIKDIKKKYNIDDMIKGDVMFCATAITNGDLANGIKDQKEFYEASTIALHKDGKVNTLFKNKHKK